jgi:transaldolase
MKIFLDSVDIEQIERWAFFIDGITTNPTLLSKNGTDPREHIKKLLALLPNKEISVEVTQLEPDAMYAQARNIAQLGSNVLVKIPCHVDYYPVIGRLASEGIKLNITLVFNVFQAVSMCKLGATYISPFVGRLEDHDEDGIDLLVQLRAVIDTYAYKTQILAASIRNAHHVHEALLAGVDAITMPPSVLTVAATHQLTDEGIKKFNADWQKLGVSTFP